MTAPEETKWLQRRIDLLRAFLQCGTNKGGAKNVREEIKSLERQARRHQGGRLP